MSHNYYCLTDSVVNIEVIYNRFAPTKITKEKNIYCFGYILTLGTMWFNISKNNKDIKNFEWKQNIPNIYLILNCIIMIYNEDIKIYEIKEKNIIKKIVINDFGLIGIVDFGKVCMLYGSDICIVITETDMYEITYTFTKCLLLELKIIENYGKKIKYY